MGSNLKKDNLFVFFLCYYIFMNTSLLIILCAIISTIGTYINKKIVDKGISRENFFYYMCLTMVFFSCGSLALEVKSNNFHFEFSWILVVLLILAMLLRYARQTSFVGYCRKLEPYEFETYMSFSLVICFIIDCLIGAQNFSAFKVLSILFIILGIIFTYNVKINVMNIQKDLILKLIAEVGTSYIIYYALRYCSNGLFILCINLILVIIFTFIYKPYKKENRISKELFILFFIQQAFGFSKTYISNYLSSQSATLAHFISPVSLILITLMAFVLKREQKPSMKNMLGIGMACLGILLIKMF